MCPRSISLIYLLDLSPWSSPFRCHHFSHFLSPLFFGLSLPVPPLLLSLFACECATLHLKQSSDVMLDLQRTWRRRKCHVTQINKLCAMTLIVTLILTRSCVCHDSFIWGVSDRDSDFDLFTCVPWLWFRLIHMCAITHSFDESLIVTLIFAYSCVPWLWFRLIHMCAMTLTVTLIFQGWNKAETKRQNGLQKRVCFVSVYEMRLKSYKHAQIHTHTQREG